MSLVILVAAAGVALVGLIAYLSWLSAKKRREALQQLAAQRGWSYTERDDRWCHRFDGSPFGQGHNRQARNVLEGHHDGRPFVGFDYVYHTTETSTDSEGRTQRREVSHPYSVLGLHIGGSVPSLQVTPEGFFGRMVGKLMNSDIELESEEFNRAFTVSSQERKFAFDVLHPRLMEFLLTQRDVAWRTTGTDILTIESGRHDLADIDRRLRVIDHILDTLPDFVREQYALPAVAESGPDPTPSP